MFITPSTTQHGIFDNRLNLQSARMNKLLLVSFCALVALCAAQDFPIPGANLLSAFNAFLPENVCGPSCNGICNAQKAFCISVPPFVDCDAILDQCLGLCQSACGCLINCRNTCEEKNPCPAEGQGLQNLLCQGRVNTCVGLCQLSCPAQTQFLIFQQSIQAAMAQFQQLIAAFSSSMIMPR